MQLEKKLAKILAREVAYRSYRRYGAQGLPMGKFSRLHRSEPSALRSNALVAVILSFVSIFMGLIPLLGAKRLDPNLAFVLSSSTMLFFEAFMTIFIVTSFTSVFMSERIVELFNTLPLAEKDIFKAYFRALLLYWGGLAPIFAFVPGAILGFIAALYGHVTPVLPALLCFAGFAVLVFSYSLGIALGSYARKVKKRASLRFLSTIGWLIAFAFFYSWNYIVKYVLQNISAETVAWASLLPFIGVLFGYENSYTLLISTVETIIVVAIVLEWAVTRLKVVMGLTPITPVAPAKVPVKEKVRIGAIRLKVKPVPLQFAVKDLILLSREPRRLANILYFVVVPILMIMPSLTSRPKLGTGGMIGGFMALMSVVMLSTLPGVAVDVMYYVEGESAKVLYYMPISRRKLAFYKAVSVVPFAVLASTVVGVILAYIFNSIVLGILTFLATLASSPFIALLFSSITVRMLPESPSAWSEASVSRRLLAIVKIAVFTGLIIFAAITSIFLTPLFWEKAPLVTLLIYLAATSTAGVIAYISIPKHEPV